MLRASRSRIEGGCVESGAGDASRRSLAWLLPLAGFVTLVLATTAEAGWYNTAWPYRKALIINGQRDAGDCGTGVGVPGTAPLANFPVLVSLTDAAGLGANAQADGDDILFTS